MKLRVFGKLGTWAKTCLKRLSSGKIIKIASLRSHYAPLDVPDALGYFTALNITATSGISANQLQPAIHVDARAADY